MPTLRVCPGAVPRLLSESPSIQTIHTHLRASAELGAWRQVLAELEFFRKVSPRRSLALVPGSVLAPCLPPPRPLRLPFNPPPSGAGEPSTNPFPHVRASKAVRARITHIGQIPRAPSRSRTAANMRTCTGRSPLLPLPSGREDHPATGWDTGASRPSPGHLAPGPIPLFPLPHLRDPFPFCPT